MFSSTRSPFFFFFFIDTATTEIYTLSLHDALPIYGHEIVHRDDDRPPPRLLDHVRVAVVEDVDDIDALRLALHAPRIEVVARRPLLRAVQRPGQDDARGIDRLRPPAHEGSTGVARAADGVAGQGADVRGETNLETEVAALQPVMQAMGVLIHSSPTLEGKIRYQQHRRQ